MSSETTYKFEPLKAHNWLPWKTRIEAIVADKKLTRFLTASEESTSAAVATSPTEEESEALEAWQEQDAKVRSIIVLNVSDAEMIHITGAKTAAEMWKNLKMVKESSSGVGKLTARRKLYRTFAEEGSDIAEHISKMRQILEELHTMGVKIEDQDFLDILMSSLPESWDSFTMTYMTANTTGIKKITSHDFISVIYEEIRRRNTRASASDTALKAYSNSRPSQGTHRNAENASKKCSNCGKMGHVVQDCWAKGGGKEGQGPRNRRKKKNQGDNANKAEDTSAQEFDISYMADDFTAPDEKSRDAWWLDSCANQHICVNKALFTSYAPVSGRYVKGVGGKVLVHGMGTVTLLFRVGENTIRHQVKGVLHTPDFKCNLLSLGRLDEVGVTYAGSKGKISLRDHSGKTIGLGKKTRNMYLLDAIGEDAIACVTVGAAPSWEDWHRRYGHLAYSSIETLKKKGLVEGLEIDEDTKPQEGWCEACTRAKMTRRQFPKESTEQTTKPGELTLSDVWGPARVESIAKSRYYISFTDHYTRRVTVLFLKTKDEAFDRITQYLARVETKFQYTPKSIRFDNGKELINKRLEKWCAEKGIEIQATAPYSPSQNGIAERFNRTLLELARAMLIAKNLPTFLWAEAISHAAYLRNHAPTRALEGKTPEEAWTGRRPNISHLREFGSKVWIREEGSIGKLEPRANRFIFVGFEDGPKAVRYYDQAKRRIKVSRNYVFDGELPEDGVPDRDVQIEGEHKGNDNQSITSITQKYDDQTEETHNSGQNTPVSFIPAPSRRPYMPITLRQTIPRSVKTLTDYRRLGNPDVRNTSERIRALEEAAVEAELNRPEENESVAGEGETNEDNPHESHFSYAWMISDEEQKYDVPKSLRDAQESPEWPEWQAAMDEEYRQHLEMGTWELVEPVAGRRPIGCRWVFAKKFDESGKLTKYKARLVAQGFSQIPGIDYTDNYAPVARLDAVRTCIALSAIKKWTMRQLDIKGAYLNGVLEEELYMHQPDGFNDGSGRICKLKLALYGLKQAGRVWNKKLHDTLSKLDFTRTDADPCVYTKIINGFSTVLTVWVDDLIICGDAPQEIDATVKSLKNMFEIKDLGEPKLLLGIQIIRDDKTGTITLSQKNYIDTILNRFGYSKLNPVSTPLDPHINLKKRDPSLTPDPQTVKDFQTKLGSLMYAALGTMPQLAYSVQKLSQFATNPAPEHITALKRVFRYLVSAKERNLGLTYGGKHQIPTEIVGYSDADWGADTDDRKSISGFVFMLGGAAISWSSKKQASPAVSSCEAEYMAASYATRHAIWLRRLLRDLKIPISRPTTLFIDNQAALALTQDVMFSQRTKHIDIHYHFTRHHVFNGNIYTAHCPTNAMLADIMTKPLPKPQHEELSERMGVLPA
jgi:transposase InsO family protein